MGNFLQDYWTKAGGPAGQAKTAAAVALAESGGDWSSKHKNDDGTTDYGLWQINSSNFAALTKALKTPVNEATILNPELNARAAVYLATHGRGWRNWTTYTNGAYKEKLADADQTGKKPLGGDPVAGAASDAANAALSWTKALARFLSNLMDPATWLRIGKVVLGVGLGVYGIMTLLANSPTAQTVAKTAAVA